MVHPAEGRKWQHCETPASRFGWAYEAINYDIADDARLQASNPTMRDCGPLPTTTGSAVVSGDDVAIAAWYIPAASDIGPAGPTLVVAPGWKSNKSEILKYAPPFHQDYNLVLVDLRNGGRSGGDTTTWGHRERDDVHAIVDWLVEAKQPEWIGAVGNSLGAATVLLEAVDDPRIQALILDSMHASVAASFGDGIEYEAHLPGYPTAWAMAAATSLRIGTDVTALDPEQTITRLGDRPVLLIHSRKDALDVPRNSAERVFAAATAAGVPVDLQYCPTGKHGEVIEACPVAWLRWATDFLEQARD
jgi:pimeloyl-ACP methyl ester carboxylesterase